MLNFTGEGEFVMNKDLPDFADDDPFDVPNAADVTDATDFTMAEGESITLGGTDPQGGIQLDEGGVSISEGSVAQGGGYSI